MLSVSVAGSSRPADGRLANLSPEGACVVGPSLSEGTPILLQRNGMEMPGHVTWSAGEQSGVCFAEPLKPESILRPVAVPKQRFSYVSRRPGLKCRPLSKADIALLERSATAGRCLVR